MFFKIHKVQNSTSIDTQRTSAEHIEDYYKNKKIEFNARKSLYASTAKAVKIIGGFIFVVLVDAGGLTYQNFVNQGRVIDVYMKINADAWETDKRILTAQIERDQKDTIKPSRFKAEPSWGKNLDSGEGY